MTTLVCHVMPLLRRVLQWPQCYHKVISRTKSENCFPICQRGKQVNQLRKEMIPIVDKETADYLIEQGEPNMLPYRHDIMKFRLALTLRSHPVWQTFIDDFPDVSVVMHVRKGTGYPDFAITQYDVINRPENLAEIVADMAVKVREWGDDVLVFNEIEPDHVEEVKRTVSTSYELKMTETEPVIGFIRNTKINYSPPLPEGFEVRPLDSKADYVNNFNSDQGFCEGRDIKTFMCDLIDHMPSAGIFTNDNVLVGYILTNDYGSLGKLYVQPHYRRRGLGTHLHAYMTNKILDDGYLRHCFAEASVSNKKAIGCIKKGGYEYVEDSERFWFLIGEKK